MLFTFTWEFKAFSLTPVVICQRICLLQGGYLTVSLTVTGKKKKKKKEKNNDKIHKTN